MDKNTSPQSFTKKFLGNVYGLRRLCWPKHGISYVPCYAIITQILKTQKLSKKLVPRELNPDQCVPCAICVTLIDKKTRVDHTTTIDEARLNFNSQPKRNQAREIEFGRSIEPPA